MKNIFKSLLIFFVVFSMIGCIDCIGAFLPKASAASITSYEQGDTIEFGWYPQSEVTDENIISTLNEIDGEWISYGYYSGSGTFNDGQMTSKDYMRYKDVILGADKYRGVTFDTYRPKWTSEETLSTYSCTYQKSNGYSTEIVYWFKYEPIVWRVLNPETGMLMAETLLDSQPFNNFILESGTDEYGDDACWGDSDKTFYCNDYANSSIRKWLNDEFYNTAFSSEQQNIIEYTSLDNSAYSSKYSAYDSKATFDKIYLLSYNDVYNNNYGFSSSDYDSKRITQGTDYAKCQGLYVFKSSGVVDKAYSGNSYWWLRSAGYSCHIPCHIYYDSDVSYFYTYYHYGPDGTYSGIRPILNLDLSSEIIQSDVKFTGESFACGLGSYYTVEFYTMNTDGVYEKSVQCYSGKTNEIISLTPPVPDGFTINYKKSDIEGVVSNNNSLTLKVYYDRNIYSLITNVDGVKNITYCYYEDKIPEIVSPTKTGYSFVGWDREIPLTMPDSDVIVNALFIPNKYDAIFKANGGIWSDGEITKKVLTDYNDYIVAPESPVRDGYVFSGWTPEIGVMDDINGKIFTAIWSAVTDTNYTVETYTMNTSGEYEVTTRTFSGATGESVEAEYTVLTGFTLNAEKSVLEGTIAADNSLVLKVYIDRNTYTFTTVVDGVSTSKSYLYGSIVSEPVTPSKSGYKFIKWNGTIPQTMPAEKVTVTAEFEKSYICPDCSKEILGEDAINKHIASETKVNIDGGSIVSGVVSPGAKITVSAPQTHGKIFSHWEVTNATVADANSSETIIVLGSGKISITAVYDDCDCKCHQGGIAGFFFKITLFFQKLFGKNLECVCGAKH